MYRILQIANNIVNKNKLAIHVSVPTITILPLFLLKYRIEKIYIYVYTYLFTYLFCLSMDIHTWKLPQNKQYDDIFLKL